MNNRFDKAIELCLMVWVVALVASIRQWPSVIDTRNGIESYVLSQKANRASKPVVNRIPAIVSRK